jgi:hypothetical protein
LEVRVAWAAQAEGREKVERGSLDFACQVAMGIAQASPGRPVLHVLPVSVAERAALGKSS